MVTARGTTAVYICAGGTSESLVVWNGRWMTLVRRGRYYRTEEEWARRDAEAILASLAADWTVRP